MKNPKYPPYEEYLKQVYEYEQGLNNIAGSIPYPTETDIEQHASYPID